MGRHQADTVSPAYVAQASESLVAGRRRKLFTLVGTFGGILLGVAVSSFVEMMSSATVTGSEAVIGGVLGIAGSIMVAIQFSRE